MHKLIFRLLRALRGTYDDLPGISSYMEYRIAIEIGYHQECGSPLTLKQLLLLNISSEATVRRHLRALVAGGVVLRSKAMHDHRAVYLELSQHALETFHRQFLQVEKIVGQLAGRENDRY